VSRVASVKRMDGSLLPGQPPSSLLGGSRLAAVGVSFRAMGASSAGDWLWLPGVAATDGAVMEKRGSLRARAAGGAIRERAAAVERWLVALGGCSWRRAPVFSKPPRRRLPQSREARWRPPRLSVSACSRLLGLFAAQLVAGFEWLQGHALSPPPVVPPHAIISGARHPWSARGAFGGRGFWLGLCQRYAVCPPCGRGVPLPCCTPPLNRPGLACQLRLGASVCSHGSHDAACGRFSSCEGAWLGGAVPLHAAGVPPCCAPTLCCEQAVSQTRCVQNGLLEWVAIGSQKHALHPDWGRNPLAVPLHAAGVPPLLRPHLMLQAGRLSNPLRF
jgi:hypothetical protein